MSIQNALASLPVKNLSVSIQWYEKLFGRAADSNPMPEVAEWKFDRGGWLQVFQATTNAGNGSVTLAVDNLAEQISDLKNLGIETGSQSGGDNVKVIMIKDPDGNSIAFAEALDKTIAH